MISAVCYRALSLIREKPGIYPGDFARRMWPESPAWGHVTNAGSGAVRGAGMRQAGGAYMGKLRRRGLIGVGMERVGATWGSRHDLTEEGVAAMSSYEAAHPGVASASSP